MLRTALTRASAPAALAAVCLVAPSVSAQACFSDDDCPDGTECDLPPQIGVACDPEGGSCDASVPERSPGDCEPAPLRCATDADCPSGLTCEHRDGDCASAPDSPPSGAAGGGADDDAPPPEDEACEPVSDEGVCVFEIEACDGDSECSGDDVCAEVGRTSECSAASSCAPGEECPPPEQEVCVDTTISYCMPPRMDCDDGQTCASGMRCVELPEKIQEDAPPAWAGATALCLTEVWALAVEGRIDVEGDGRSASESGSISRDTAAGGQSESKSTSDDQPGDPEGAGASGASDDGGCAVSAPGAASRAMFAAFPALASVALVLARRRRRPRS